mmetsp:Transcript_9102/g.13628  ORF Transcript_9102/g.13628 Transcript_9102/m.13628 type:complete len:201 (+) Transcript_9102:781-1383(+)
MIFLARIICLLNVTSFKLLLVMPDPESNRSQFSFSTLITVRGVTARIEADLGALLTKPASPKKSPAPIILTLIELLPQALLGSSTKTSAFPEVTKYIPFGMSLSRNTNSPAENFSTFKSLSKSSNSVIFNPSLLESPLGFEFSLSTLFRSKAFCFESFFEIASFKAVLSSSLKVSPPCSLITRRMSSVEIRPFPSLSKAS